MYEYLLWVIILGIAWSVLYFAYPRLRFKILWSGFVALPFGFGELYFIPNYWIPGTLFNLGLRYGLDIESFFLMFFLGGLAAFAYEAVFKKKVLLMKHNSCFCYLSLAVALAVFVVLTKMFSWNIIYISILACLAGAVFAFVVYPLLRWHILFGAVIFALLYWISLTLMNFISPGWIAATWKLSLLSGILLLGVPVEELLFGFAFGALWTSLFEETCRTTR